MSFFTIFLFTIICSHYITMNTYVHYNANKTLQYNKHTSVNALNTYSSVVYMSTLSLVLSYLNALSDFYTNKPYSLVLFILFFVFLFKLCGDVFYVIETFPCIYVFYLMQNNNNNLVTLLLLELWAYVFFFFL